ncbi:MAG: hypothetical protein IH991_25100, partial [Planctomycetes bacterium]|nr:hypothetical protein [Planctomycetota bacterium]
MEFLAWLLGLKNVTKIESVEIALSATWAKEGPFWVVLGVACLLAVSLLFYLKFQQRGGTGTRITLALMRGVLLA